MSTVRRYVFALAGGGALAGVVAALAGIPVRDTIALVGISFGVAIAAHAAGSVAMPVARRRRGVAAAATVVAVVPLLSVAAGMLAAAQAMFVSTHDLAALSVIVVGSGAAGVLGALALARELAAARREAAEAERRSAQTERSRRELVAWVSHDLRTPLAGIRAMVEAIEDGVVDDATTVDRYHRQIGEEVTRLTGLVDDLFELSRIEADALQLTFERIQLADVVGEAVDGAAVLAHAKGIHIHGDDRGGGETIDASSRELTRVLRNLLDNAIRHTPSGGVVNVGVERHERAVVVSISDQCGGIPDDDIGRVFDVAYRGDSARTTDGAGLGLAIARGFVEAHRGAIDVRNHDGGCCFRITLPIAPTGAMSDVSGS